MSREDRHTAIKAAIIGIGLTVLIGAWIAYVYTIAYGWRYR